MSAVILLCVRFIPDRLFNTDYFGSELSSVINILDSVSVGIESNV